MNFQDIHKLLLRESYKIAPALDLKQLSKFSLIGILNTILGYGLFVIFLYWFNYLVASIFSHIIAVTHSYLWNKFWTFKFPRPGRAGIRCGPPFSRGLCCLPHQLMDGELHRPAICLQPP